MKEGTGISLTEGMELFELDPSPRYASLFLSSSPESEWKEKDWAKLIAPLLAEPHIFQYKLLMISTFIKRMPKDQRTKTNVDRVIKFCHTMDALFR